jgi:hypothetical protein
MAVYLISYRIDVDMDKLEDLARNEAKRQENLRYESVGFDTVFKEWKPMPPRGMSEKKKAKLKEKRKAESKVEVPSEEEIPADYAENKDMKLGMFRGLYKFFLPAKNKEEKEKDVDYDNITDPRYAYFDPKIIKYDKKAAERNMSNKAAEELLRLQDRALKYIPPLFVRIRDKDLPEGLLVPKSLDEIKQEVAELETGSKFEGTESEEESKGLAEPIEKYQAVHFRKPDIFAEIQRHTGKAHFGRPKRKNTEMPVISENEVESREGEDDGESKKSKEEGTLKKLNAKDLVAKITSSKDEEMKRDNSEVVDKEGSDDKELNSDKEKREEYEAEESDWNRERELDDPDLTEYLDDETLRRLLNRRTKKYTGAELKERYTTEVFDENNNNLEEPPIKKPKGEPLERNVKEKYEAKPEKKEEEEEKKEKVDPWEKFSKQVLPDFLKPEKYCECLRA